MRFSCINSDPWLEDQILKYDLSEDGTATLSYFDSQSWHHLQCQGHEEVIDHVQIVHKCSASMGQSGFTEVLIGSSGVSYERIAYQTVLNPGTPETVHWKYACSY